jgi:hypothetical protein
VNIAVDTQKVVDVHRNKIKLGLAKRQDEAIKVPAVAKAAGLSCQRVWAVYAYIAEVYGPLKTKVLVPNRQTGGHVLYSHFDRKMYRRFMREQRTRTQFVETMTRRTRKKYDVAAVMAITAGKTTEFTTLTNFAATQRVIEHQAAADRSQVEALLPTL